MRYSCTSIVVTLAFPVIVSAHVGQDKSAHVVKGPTNASPPILPLSPEGGLAGVAQIGGSGTTVTDRTDMFEAMGEYSRRYGPFSTPGTRGTYQAFPVFPAGAREWGDLIMHDYVDLHPSEDDFLDWNCSGYTYNGSRVNTALIKSFDHQLIGVPVIAVLDGTVVQVHDGEPDQNTEPSDQLTNYVGIHHGGDRYCWYESLKQGSVSVEVDQEVRAGEQIGLVASSGGVNWPGLRFSTWEPTGNEDEWGHVEPYAGPCNPGSSGWVNQVDIPTGPRCRQFGVTTTDLNDFFADEVYSWRPPLEGSITLDHDSLWMWTHATDIGIWSTYSMQFYDPSGNLNYDSGTNWLNFSSTSYRHFITWFAWDLPGLHTIPGTWTVHVIVNGYPYIEFPLEVLESGETLANRPPEPVAAFISPWNATADDMLTCNVHTVQVDDPDWDLVRFQYKWTIAGEVVRETVSAGLADHLPRLEGCDGAVVECQVIPSDGVLDGPVSIHKIRLSGNSYGDSNCDGSVDIQDLLVVLNDWGICSICSGDHNQDGKVNITDLLIVIAFWG